MSVVMSKKIQKTRTAYQTHVRHLSAVSNNILDFSEFKMVRLATSHKDENVRKLIVRMLHDYQNGKIAIAWEEGNLPVYCFIKPREQL